MTHPPTEAPEVSDQLRGAVDDLIQSEREYDEEIGSPFPALRAALKKRRKEARTALLRYIADLEADKKRMDWLETQIQPVEKDSELIAHAWGVYGQTDSLRSAIDTATNTQEGR